MTHVPSFSRVDPIAALHAHFTAAVALLRAFPPPGLDAAQRVTRALLLEELEGYADRGVFPQNRHFPGERRPTFVDDNGVLCAVGHLLDMTGQGALALEVRDTHNTATVADLAGDARFAAWAWAAGFTLEELAVVQPNYCSIARYSCVCRKAYPLEENEAIVVLAIVEGDATGMVEVREVVEARVDLPLGPMKAMTHSRGHLSVREPVLARVSYVEDLGLLQIDETYSAIDGGVPCKDWATPALPLGRAELVRALLSAGSGACRDYLMSLDARWAETGLEIDPVAARCSRVGPKTPSTAFDTRGCTSAPENTPPPAAESLVVLAALLTALAARRAYRRRSEGQGEPATQRTPRTS